MSQQVIEGEPQHRGIAIQPERPADEIDLVLFDEEGLAHALRLLSLHLRAAIACRHRPLPYTPMTFRPQSTNITSAVIADASGLHRKTAALATSSGLMPRGSGDRAAA